MFLSVCRSIYIYKNTYLGVKGVYCRLVPLKVLEDRVCWDGLPAGGDLWGRVEAATDSTGEVHWKESAVVVSLDVFGCEIDFLPSP